MNLFINLLLIFIINIINNCISSPIDLLKRQCCCCNFKKEAVYAYLTDCEYTCEESLNNNNNNINNINRYDRYSHVMNIPFKLQSHGSRNRYCMNTCNYELKNLQPLYIEQKKYHKIIKKKKIKHKKIIIKPNLNCLWYQKKNSKCRTDAWSPIRKSIDMSIKENNKVNKYLLSAIKSPATPNLDIPLMYGYKPWRNICKLWICFTNVTETFFLAEYDSKDGKSHVQHCSKLMGYPKHKMQNGLQILTRFSYNNIYLAAPWKSRFWLLNNIGHSISDMCRPYVESSRPFQVMNCWKNQNIGGEQLKIWRLFSELLECTRESYTSIKGCNWESKYSNLLDIIQDTIIYLKNINKNQHSPCYGVYNHIDIHKTI